MDIVLIYDCGDEFKTSLDFKEFDSETELINFINKNNIGHKIIDCYKFNKKIKFEAVEKVIHYKIKD